MANRKPAPAIPEDDPELKALELISGMPEGRLVLGILFRMSGYDKPSVTVDPVSQEINDKCTLYNEARRNIWVELRKFIPRLHLIDLEMPLPITRIETPKNKENEDGRRKRRLSNKRQQ